jgi:hypothetical protein
MPGLTVMAQEFTMPPSEITVKLPGIPRLQTRQANSK